MYNLHLCLDRQLFAIEKPKPTLIMPEADDPRTVEAAERLTKFANVVLLTSREQLEALIDESGVAERFWGTRERLLRMVKCVEVDKEEKLLEEFAEAYVRLGRGKKWESGIDAAREKVRHRVHFSVLATRLGYTDMVVGGANHRTRDFFIPCLRLLERQEVVYEMALFALPDDHTEEIYEQNLVLFADVALNPVPTPEALARIAIGSCKTMRDIIPLSDIQHINGALISYSTRGSGEGPSVERIRQAGKLIPGMLENLRKEDPIYQTVRIESELQISVAVSMSAARSKLGDLLDESSTAGRANVLIAPNLDVGNLLYHIYAARYSHSQHLLLIGGLHNRALDFSRSSTADDIILGAKGLILRNLKSRNFRPTPRDYFFPRYRVLAINPGSTSTKVALFQGTDPVFKRELRHDAEELRSLGRIPDQLETRLRVVEQVLEDESVEAGSLHAVVGRGGLVHPVKSGTYKVGEKMLADLRAEVGGSHASNLGAAMAAAIAGKHNAPAFVVDPPVVDELNDTARITGLPEVVPRPAWHALNQKACAKRFADERGKEYDRLNLIVAHLGGGISVGAHRQGKCIHVRDALLDGPMTPQRSGSLPQHGLIELCFSGADRQELIDRLVNRGGLLAHLGTDDLVRIEEMIAAGDRNAKKVFEAMVQQIAAEIGSLIPRFMGERLDQIIISGGMSRSELLVSQLFKLLTSLGVPVTVYPGENELEALRDGAIRVLWGHEEPLEYGVK
jgi:butyrate kinase